MNSVKHIIDNPAMKSEVLLISFNYNKCYYAHHLDFLESLIHSNISAKHKVIDWYSPNMWKDIKAAIQDEQCKVVYFLCDSFDIISSDLAEKYAKDIRGEFGGDIFIGIQSQYDKYFLKDGIVGQYFVGSAGGFAQAVQDISHSANQYRGNIFVADVHRDYSPYILDIGQLKYFTLESESFCKYTCSFCYKSDNVPSRITELHQVEKYLQIASSLGFKYVWFLDPTSNENKNITRLLSLLEKYDKFEYIFEVRAESFSHDVYMIFSQISKVTFNVGLQSISPVVSKNIQRYFQKDAYLKGIMWMKKIGKVNIDIILGLPGETKNSFLSTYVFAKNLDASSVRIFLLENRPNAFSRVSYQDHHIFSSEYPYKLIESDSLSREDIEKLSTYFTSCNVDFN